MHWSMWSYCSLALNLNLEAFNRPLVNCNQCCWLPPWVWTVSAAPSLFTWRAQPHTIPSCQDIQPHLPSILQYKSHQIATLKYFLYPHAVVFAQFIEAMCYVDNEDVVGAAPTGDAPTTSEWSTIALPTKVCLILEILRYVPTQPSGSTNTAMHTTKPPKTQKWHIKVQVAGLVQKRPNPTV